VGEALGHLVRQLADVEWLFIVVGGQEAGQFRPVPGHGLEDGVGVGLGVGHGPSRGEGVRPLAGAIHDARLKKRSVTNENRKGLASASSIGDKARRTKRLGSDNASRPDRFPS
jgi:hypothetical protein